MEPEEGKQEEPERPILKRRSSILKLPKVPSEQFDITETYTDFNVSKPVRRVSFASSNFIKPFVADPEQNTLWDTTYEEDVNHTNSTQSSQEQILSTCNKSRLTSHSIATPKTPVGLENATILSEHTMEITNVLSFVDKENIPCYPHKKISIVDYAKKRSANFIAPTQKLNIFEDSDDAHGNVTELPGMEFTCQNLNPFMKSEEHDLDAEDRQELNCTIRQETEMDLAEDSVDEQGVDELQRSDGSAMQFTCQVLQTNLKEEGTDMEYTCQIPQDNLVKINTNGNKIPQTNLTKTSEDMELSFTCQVSSNQINDFNAVAVKSGNLTQACDNLMPEKSPATNLDMEFTCQVSPNQMNIDLEVNSKQYLADVTTKVNFQMSDNKLSKTLPSDITGKKVKPVLLTNTFYKTSQNKSINDRDNLENTSQRNVSSRVEQNLESMFYAHGLHNVVKTSTTDIIEKSILEGKSYSEMEVDESSSHQYQCSTFEANFQDISKPDILSVSNKLSKTATSHVIDYVPNVSSKICQGKYESGRVEVEVNTRADISKMHTDEGHRAEVEVDTRADISKMHRAEVEVDTRADISNMHTDEGHRAEVEVDTRADISKMYTDEGDRAEVEVDTRADISKMHTDEGHRAEVEVDTRADISKMHRDEGHRAEVEVDTRADISKVHTDEGDRAEVEVDTRADISKTHTDIEHAPKSSKVSQIPIRTNLSNLSTLDTFSAKIERTLQNRSELLNLPPTSPIEDLKTKITIPLPKLPLSFLQEETSVLKTPEPSFHINLTNISSGMDDTQHLLQCTYSKPNPLFMRSRLENKDETGFGLNLEEAGHVSKPDLIDINLEETKDSPDTSTFDILRNKSKLLHVNDTYVLRNKQETEIHDSEETMNETDDADEDTSLGLLTEDCLQTLGNEIQPTEKSLEKEVRKIPTRSVEDFKVKEYPNFKIRRISEIQDLLDNVKKRDAEITSFLKDFECRPMRIPTEFIVEQSFADTSESTSEISEASVRGPTVEEKIRERQESCHKCWTLEKVDEEFYHFATLFGTLKFVVRLNLETVVDIETVDKLAGDAKPIARYIMKLFVDKLKKSHVTSAIGNNCDILSLLDYVQMTMLQFQKFQCDFMKSGFLSMEEDFVAKFTVLSTPLVLSCNILVDVSNLENLDSDKHIRIVTRKGSIKESEIKNLARNCAKGLDFFSSFEKNIQEYIDVKEKGLT